MAFQLLHNYMGSIDLIFIPIAVVIFNIFIFTFNLLAGFNTIIHSSDNRNFKVDDKRIEKQIQK